MAKGQAVHPIGRTNMKPILDEQLYEVENLGGEITDLSANLIAE